MQINISHIKQMTSIYFLHIQGISKTPSQFLRQTILVSPHIVVFQILNNEIC